MTSDSFIEGLEAGHTHVAIVDTRNALDGHATRDVVVKA